ncbi:MAG: hypothetical protein GY928_03465 [Colwellia sp.]|nr:hypothetical protein [Colwellia sp.]
MTSSINPNAGFSQDVRSLAKAPEKKENGPVGQQAPELFQEEKTPQVSESIVVNQKKQLDAAIVESSLKFNNSIGEQPLSLVLKAALQGINEALQAGGLETSVEDTYESGIDYSPEATAERIVAFSTQMYGSYKEQHPEMEEDELLTSFIDVIGGGIEQGFAEAKDILGGLKVLDGDIATNVDKTYELVQEGLQSFIDSFSETEQE